MGLFLKTGVFLPSATAVPATVAGAIISNPPEYAALERSPEQERTQVAVSFASTGTGFKDVVKKVARGIFSPLAKIGAMIDGPPPDEELGAQRAKALKENEVLQKSYHLAIHHLMRAGIDDLTVSTSAAKDEGGRTVAIAKFRSGDMSVVLSEEYFTGETDHTISEISDYVALHILAQQKSDPITNIYLAWTRTRLPSGLAPETILEMTSALPPLDLTTINTIPDVCAAIRRYLGSATEGFILGTLDQRFSALETERDQALTDALHALAPHIRAMDMILQNADNNSGYKARLLERTGPLFLDEMRSVTAEARRRGVFEETSPDEKKMRTLHDNIKVFFKNVAKVNGLPSPPAFEKIPSADERARAYYERSSPIRDSLPEIVARLEVENGLARAAGFETAYDYFLKTSFGLEYQEAKVRAERFRDGSEKDLEEFIDGIRRHHGGVASVHPWDIEFAMNRWIMAESGVAKEPTVTLKTALNLVRAVVDKKFGFDIYDPRHGIIIDLARTDRHPAAMGLAVSISQSDFWKIASSNMDPEAITLKGLSSILHEIAGHITHSILTRERLKKIGSPDSITGVLRDPVFTEVFSVLAQDFLADMKLSLFKSGVPLKYLDSYVRISRLYDIFRQRRAAFWAISERILYDNKNFPTIESKEKEMDRLQEKWLKTSSAPAYGYWPSEFYFWPYVGRYWLGLMTPIYAEKIKTLAAESGSTVEAFLRPYLESGGEAGMELIR